MVLRQLAAGRTFAQNSRQGGRHQGPRRCVTGSAGYLIDQAGLKGKTVGGFQVSTKHANFIINTGDGKHQELRELIDLVKETVKRKYDINLKEEVQVI